ncbi:MAG: hypothetical protein ACI4SC_07135 [Candidatus Neoclostridium sp.]
MIEFKGELSANCKKFVLSEETKVARLSAIIPSIPMAIADIWISLSVDLFYLIFLPVLIFIVVLAGLTPKEKSYGLIMTKKVELCDDYLSSEGEKFEEVRVLDDVKCVVDYGDWYKIYFYFPHKSLRFICQKDLLVKGTIEEFEEMFAGRIKRKIQSK